MINSVPDRESAMLACIAKRMQGARKAKKCRCKPMLAVENFDYLTEYYTCTGCGRLVSLANAVVAGLIECPDSRQN